MKLLFDESLSPRLVESLADLFPDSESGLAGAGDLKILQHAASGGFVLVSTDGDFAGLLDRVPAARVVLLRNCNYPTHVAAHLLRRNAIRIATLPSAAGRLLVLERGEQGESA